MPLIQYSPEEIRAFAEKVQMGLCQEYELLYFIATALITIDQIKWLKDHNLTGADLLHGSFVAEDYEEVENIFKDWNAKLGTDIFKFS
jgi:hypothetical protein